jgi:hypothetical protein
MNILDNELVRKYFGCQHKANGRNLICDCVAGDAPQKILEAMQQPIRKGEYILQIMPSGEIHDKNAWVDYDGLHLDLLRLPDRFQKKKCPHLWEIRCSECGESGLELRDLVQLARRYK